MWSEICGLVRGVRDIGKTTLLNDGALGYLQKNSMTDACARISFSWLCQK